MAGPIFSALERLGLSMVATNPQLFDNPIVFVNEAFSQITGYSPAEAVGCNCRFSQAPETDERVISDSGSRQVRSAISIELLNRRKSGNSSGIMFSSRRSARGGGSPVLPLGHRWTSLRRIRRGKRRPRSKPASGSLIRPTSVFASPDRRRDRRVLGVGHSQPGLTADARFAALHDLDPAEASKGLPAEAFFAAIHPDDRLRIRLAVGGTSMGRRFFPSEYRLLASDGAVRWVHARALRHFGDDDRPLRFTGVAIDITEQKHVEERLRIAQSAGGIGTFEYVHGFATASVSGEFCRLLGLHPTNVLPVRTINALVVSGDAAIINKAWAPNGRPTLSSASGARTITNSAGWRGEASTFRTPKRQDCDSSASSMTSRRKTIRGEASGAE